jgi:hypothetical protein
MADVRARLLSVEKARREYGVVVDPQTLLLDAKTTSKLRSTANHGEDHE